MTDCASGGSWPVVTAKPGCAQSVDLLLVLDTSGSIEDDFNKHRDLAIELVCCSWLSFEFHGEVKNICR